LLDLSSHLTTNERLLIAATQYGAITSFIAGGMLGSGHQTRALAKIQARLRELHRRGYLDRARGRSSDGSLGYLYWPTSLGRESASAALERWPSPIPDESVLEFPGRRVRPEDAAEQAMFDRERAAEATLGFAEVVRPYAPVERSRMYPVRQLWTVGPQYFGEGPDGPISVDGVVTIGRPFFDVLVLADTGQSPEFEAVRIARLAPLIAGPSQRHRYDSGIGLVILVVSDGDGRAGHVAQAADRLLVTDLAGRSVQEIRSRVFCCSIDAIGRPVLRYRDDQIVRRGAHGRSRRRHFPDPTYRVYTLPKRLPEPGVRGRMVNLGDLTLPALRAAAFRPRVDQSGPVTGVAS
jgi:hypothetical protein